MENDSGSSPFFQGEGQIEQPEKMNISSENLESNDSEGISRVVTTNGPSSTPDSNQHSDVQTSRRRIRILLMLLLLGYVILHTWRVTKEYEDEKYDSIDTYNEELANYRNDLQTQINRFQSQRNVDVNTLGLLGSDGATTSNFEGPTLQIHSLEFENDIIDPTTNPGIEDFSITSLTFDPDHPKLGLPDLDVKVSPVRVFQPDKSGLNNLFEKAQHLNLISSPQNGGGPKPYRIYHKLVQTSDSSLQKVAMQLWLTEFKVTFTINSDGIRTKAKNEILKMDSQFGKNTRKHINDRIDRVSDSIDQNRKWVKEQQKAKKQNRKEWDKVSAQLQAGTKKIIQQEERIRARSTAKRRAKLRILEAEQIRQQQTLSQLDSLLFQLNRSISRGDSLHLEFHKQLTDLKHQLRNRPGKKYPAYWYGKALNNADSIRLEDLSKEGKNQGYNNIKVWLQVTPNSAPWYVKTKYGKNVQPMMAIGAIYCTKVENRIDNVPEYLIGSNTIEGIAMGMYDFPKYHSFRVADELLAPLPPDSYFFQLRDTASIWNKPYYLKIFLTNIGSHLRRNIWNGKIPNKYDDQVTFSFLMPLFVRGSWDVIPPEEVIPNWNPPQPRMVEGFKLKHLLPRWHFFLGGFGRVISTILLIVGGLLIASFFLPALGPLLMGALNLVLGSINKFLRNLRSRLNRGNEEGTN